MAIHCPQCGRSHDTAKFEGNKPVKCGCGNLLSISLLETIADFERYFESEDERENAYEIQKDAREICQMILDDRCPKVDIDIAKGNLESKARDFFPDKMDLYRMVYESRFNRLWDQFRGSDNGE